MHLLIPGGQGLEGGEDSVEFSTGHNKVGYVAR